MPMPEWKPSTMMQQLQGQTKMIQSLQRWPKAAIHQRLNPTTQIQTPLPLNHDRWQWNCGIKYAHNGVQVQMDASPKNAFFSDKTFANKHNTMTALSAWIPTSLIFDITSAIIDNETGEMLDFKQLISRQKCKQIIIWQWAWQAGAGFTRTSHRHRHFLFHPLWWNPRKEVMYACIVCTIRPQSQIVHE